MKLKSFEMTYVRNVVIYLLILLRNSNELMNKKTSYALNEKHLYHFYLVAMHMI